MWQDGMLIFHPDKYFQESFSDYRPFTLLWLSPFLCTEQLDCVQYLLPALEFLIHLKKPSPNVPTAKVSDWSPCSSEEQ